MTNFKFDKGDPLYLSSPTEPLKHVFDVAKVDDEGRATLLTLAENASTFSQALSDATKLTGASSAWAGTTDNTIELRHGHHPTSPYFICDRAFA